MTRSRTEPTAGEDRRELASTPLEREAELRTGRSRKARGAARIAQGALRGAVAAMAMTGLREFTHHVGWLEEPPPEAIARQKLLPGRFRRMKGRRRAQVELLHWTYGAAAGAGFAALPRRLRQGRWTGAVFGLVVWTGFELGVAPMLGLAHARRARPRDRLALAADHVLYGLVLSGPGRPQG